MLDRANPPTAVFASNNRILLGVLKAAHRRGRDLAVAGFDEVEYRDLLDRRLVLATYDPDEIGRRSADLLLRRMNAGVDFDELPPMRITVPVSVT